jgi:hypothetical protein
MVPLSGVSSASESPLLIVLLSFALVVITNRDWQGWLAIILPVTTYFVGHQQGAGAAGRRKDGRRA